MSCEELEGDEQGPSGLVWREHGREGVVRGSRWYPCLHELFTGASEKRNDRRYS